MAKYKVIHDFWGKKEHRYFFAGQTIDVDDDRAEELLAIHPTVGNPLIKSATPKQTAKKEEVKTDDGSVSDKK